MRLGPRTPDLKALELLVLVVEKRSIGAAARALHVSQPAASQRLRALEARLGVVLVERRPTGVIPTPAGEAAAGWAGEVLAAAEALDRGVAALRAGRGAHLRIFSSLTVAEYLLPRWLRALRRGDRRGAVTLEVGNSADVMAAVTARRATLGFVENRGSTGSLESLVVARDELVVVVPPGHSWARRRRREVDLGELASTALVVREQGSGTRDALYQALAERTGREGPFPIALELGSAALVRAAVIAGEGPAVLSRLAVERELAEGLLVEVLPAGGPLLRELRAVWRADEPPTGSAAALLAIARGETA